MFKIIKFLTDRRQIYFFPFHLRRFFLKCPKSFDLKSEKILFSLTFDLERDYGSSDGKSVKALPSFFINIKKLLKNRISTFFVQGDLVHEFKNELKDLENKGHELGLHGYHHELWGKTQWFLNDKKISVEIRENLIKKSLENFQKSNLKRPVSFRAPNMIIDNDTYLLLEKYKFKYDSSSASFFGILPLPYIKNSIFVIPPSSDPKPHLTSRKSLPVIFYNVFNLFNVLKLSKEELLKGLLRILFVQKKAGITPHLIFLTHPWEYFENSNAPISMKYCSEKNVEKLEETLKYLENNLNLEYVAFRGLASQLLSFLAS